MKTNKRGKSLAMMGRPRGSSGRNLGRTRIDASKNLGKKNGMAGMWKEERGGKKIRNRVGHQTQQLIEDRGRNGSELVIGDEAFAILKGARALARPAPLLRRSGRPCGSTPPATGTIVQAVLITKPKGANGLAERTSTYESDYLCLADLFG